MFWPREYDCALPVCTVIARAAPASRSVAAREMRLIFYPLSINAVGRCTPPRGEATLKGSPYPLPGDPQRVATSKLPTGLGVCRRLGPRRRVQAQRTANDVIVLRQLQLRAALGHLGLELG